MTTTEIRLSFSNFEFFDPEGFVIGFDKEPDLDDNMMRVQEEYVLRRAAQHMRNKADQIEEVLDG